MLVPHTPGSVGSVHMLLMHSQDSKQHSASLPGIWQWCWGGLQISGPSPPLGNRTVPPSILGAEGMLGVDVTLMG